MLKKNLFIAGILFTGMMISCNMNGTNEETNGDEYSEEIEESVDDVAAKAEMNPASNSNVKGTIVFEQTDDGIKMVVDLSGLTPGEHAIHLHEYGDCSAPDGTSAGGHWAPEGNPHGKRDEGEFHRGDLDNFTADEDSSAYFERTIEDWTIGGPENTNILGKSVIVHAQADDYTSQPSGDAGPRISCGVIQEK
jgi:Cu-Zn family superoxide dismutase